VQQIVHACALFVPPLFFPKYSKNIAQKWHLTENCGTNTATWCNINVTRSVINGDQLPPKFGAVLIPPLFLS